MNDTTPPKNAFQFLMNSTKSNNDAVAVTKAKKRSRAQDADPEENKPKKQKTELSFIVKDETGSGNEYSESVFHKLAPKPGKRTILTEFFIDLIPCYIASSFSPKKSKTKKGITGHIEYTNKIFHLIQLRSGHEILWSAVFLEPEADQEGKDKIEQLTSDTFLKLMTIEDSAGEATTSKSSFAQLPFMPNFCWYWKRAYNSTTVATLGMDHSSPSSTPKIRRVHSTVLSHHDLAQGTLWRTFSLP